MVIVVALCIKKKCYLTSDFIGLNYDTADIVENHESYHASSLWIFKRNICLRPRSECFYSFILLLLCGDIESCPGPRDMNDLTRINSSKGLKIFHHNIRGLFNNIDNITELCTNFKNIDILTLSETHISHDEPGVLFDLNDDAFTRKDRSKGRRRCCCIYFA